MMEYEIFKGVVGEKIQRVFTGEVSGCTGGNQTGR